MIISSPISITKSFGSPVSRFEVLHDGDLDRIVGASSGIGRELAKKLVHLCPTVRVVLSARREKELNELAKELQLDFERCLVLPLDLELHHDCFKSKVDLVLERFGRIDVLINNAGISQRSLIAETAYKVDARLMHINFLGTVTLSKRVLQVRPTFAWDDDWPVFLFSNLSSNRVAILLWSHQQRVTLAQRCVRPTRRLNMLYTAFSILFDWNTTKIISMWPLFVLASCERIYRTMLWLVPAWNTARWMPRPRQALIQLSVPMTSFVE